MEVIVEIDSKLIRLGRTGTKNFELLKQVMSILVRAKKPLLVKEISNRLRNQTDRDFILEQQITAPLRLLERAELATRHFKRWEPDYKRIVGIYPGWTVSTKGRLAWKQLSNLSGSATTSHQKRSFRVYIRRSSIGPYCFDIIFDPSLGGGWTADSLSCQNAVMDVLTADRSIYKCLVASRLSSRYCTIQLKRHKGHTFERGGLYIAETIAKELELALNADDQIEC
jgi:hypothetical protein